MCLASGTFYVVSRGNLVLVNLFGYAIDLFDYLINIVKHLVQL